MSTLVAGGVAAGTALVILGLVVSLWACLRFLDDADQANARADLATIRAIRANLRAARYRAAWLSARRRARRNRDSADMYRAAYEHHVHMRGVGR